MRPRTTRRFALAAMFALISFASHAAPFETGSLDPARHIEMKMTVGGKSEGSGWSGAAPSIELAWPAGEDLELAVKTQQTLITEDAGSRSGFGDLELGAKWRVFSQGRAGHRFGLTLEPQLIAPTGDASEGFGDGAWMIELPATLGREFGRWAFSAEAAYLHVFGPADDEMALSALAMLAVSETLEVGAELVADAPLAQPGDRHIRANIGLKHQATPDLEVQLLIGRSLDNGGGASITQFKIGLEYAFQ